MAGAAPTALGSAHPIEWYRAPADLEVQLRRVDVAGLARWHVNPLLLSETLMQKGQKDQKGG